MKKILLLSIMCLILSGCTANYNLKIEDNKFTETIKGNVLNSEIKINKNQTDLNYINYFISKEQTALINNNNIFYKKTLSQNKNSIDYIYSYVYNENTINDSRILKECFENFSFKKEDNKYHLFAFGDFYCDYAKETKINITTDYEVITTNATEQKNNTYIWTIKDGNINDLELYLTVNKNIKKKNPIPAWNMLKTACLFVLITLSAICIFVLKKREKEY